MAKQPRGRGRRWIAAAVLLSVAAALAGPEEAYRAGQDALDAKRWSEAADAFAEVADTAGRRADAALYWMAYALEKQGKNADALEAIDRLYSGYPASEWRDDAKRLEGSLRGDDEELKMYAVEALMNQSPERAIPVLEKILNGDASGELKGRALFVLVQQGTAEAMKIIARVARDDSDPELQTSAVHFLGVFGGAESAELLSEIYSSSDDPDLRAQVLQGFMVGGQKERILEAMTVSDVDEATLGQGIHLLGVMGAVEDLERLYEQLESAELRGQVLNAYMIAGEKRCLLDVARSDPSDELRAAAVHLLGVMGATAELAQLLEAGASEAVKQAVLQSYMVAGDRERLLAAAKDEPSDELRAQAVHLLGVMGADEELWQMYEQETSVEIKEAILNAMFIAGEVDKLNVVARGDSDPRLRRAAIHSLGLVESREARQALLAIYKEESELEVRESVLNGLFLQQDVETLIDLARNETNRQLRRAAVRYLSLIDSDEATAFMLEILDE